MVDTVANANWKRWNNDHTIFIRSTVTNATLDSGFTYKDITIFPMDITLATPTKIDDVISQPLVASAPNGFTKLGPALYQTGLMDNLLYRNRVTVSVNFLGWR